MWHLWGILSFQVKMRHLKQISFSVLNKNKHSNYIPYRIILNCKKKPKQKLYFSAFTCICAIRALLCAFINQVVFPPFPFFDATLIWSDIQPSLCRRSSLQLNLLLFFSVYDVEKMGVHKTVSPFYSLDGTWLYLVGGCAVTPRSHHRQQCFQKGPLYTMWLLILQWS